MMTVNFDARCWPQVLIRLAFVTLLIAPITHDPVNADTLQKTPNSSKVLTKEALEKAAQQFVSALRSSDADGILQQFSKTGTAFGIDSEPVPLSQIKMKMKK
ncbi:MAG TPA: hypothetical protein VGF20_01775, partial [Candidatus Acidoferrum sp.]